jgi:hypothetical protein
MIRQVARVVTSTRFLEQRQIAIFSGAALRELALDILPPRKRQGPLERRPAVAALDQSPPSRGRLNAYCRDHLARPLASSEQTVAPAIRWQRGMRGGSAKSG